MTGRVSLNLEKYLSSSTNEFFKKGNYWLGMVDDGIGKLGQHGANLGQKIAEMTGNIEASKKCQAVSDSFATTRDVAGAIRVIPAYHKLLTGQVFWQTDAEGWRKVAFDANGAAKQIPREELLNGTWIKKDGKWVNTITRQKSSDGKYIDDTHGKRVTRDWMDIAMDMFALVARTLAPMRVLHNLGAINLGKSAKTMGGIVMAVWGIVLGMNFVQALRDLIEEVDVNAMRKKFWDTLQGFLDWSAIMSDFGAGSKVPGLAIFGSVLNILSGLSYIVKEAVYYD